MTQNGDLWLEQQGGGPFLATAIHAGHEVRRELLPILALDEATRAREEDPYTDFMVKIVPSWIVPTRSRFEVDLNRPRSEAVYLEPELAWDLHIWKHPPGQKIVKKSLEEYDAFYAELKKLLTQMSRQYRRFVVFDLHAYNYRRQGPYEPPAKPELNPEINIGTGSVDRDRWGRLIDRFEEDLRNYDFFGHHLDVRENVKFEGRQLAQWVHTNFPESACVLAVEFKKFYMDEWTGVGDVEQIQAIRDALKSTLPGLIEELGRF